MTSGNFPVVDDLAARRASAARKAWQTRRAQGCTHGSAHEPQAVRANPSRTAAEEALAAFDREAASLSPDWYRAALALKQALGHQTLPAIRQSPPKPCVPPPPRWHDYPVNHISSSRVRTDLLVVTFADGEIVRAPAVSARAKPTNVGRGLRVAIAFYQARICRRNGLRSAPGFWAAVPSITSCICEDSGETFDADQCTLRTVENRKAQDWRIRNDRRRIEASPPRPE